MSVISSTRGNPQASDIAVETALPMVGAASREDLQATLNLADAEIAKLFEDRNILLTDGGTIALSSTSLTFTENLNLHINQKISGAVPQIISLGSSTRTFTNDGDMMIAVVNRSAGSATVSMVSAGSPLSAVASANQEVFLIAKRVDASGPVKRVYFRTGFSLTDGSSARLGAGGGGGGSATIVGATDFTALAEQLAESESETALKNYPGQLFDTFKSSAGSVSNLIASNSALNFSGSNLSGTYTRGRTTSSAMKSATGYGVFSLQALAPTSGIGYTFTVTSANATAGATYTNNSQTFTVLSTISGGTTLLTSGTGAPTASGTLTKSSGTGDATISFSSKVVTANTFFFAGEVTEFFPSSKNNIVATITTEDSQTSQFAIMDTIASPTVVAMFPNSSTSYEPLTDLTTVVLTNSNSFDLTMGLSNSNYPNNLRVIPFDWTFAAKSLTASAFENLSIVDLHSLQSISLPAETFLRKIGNIAGSIYHIEAKISPNGQYGIIRVLEHVASAPYVYHWFATNDRGVNWTVSATTKTTNNGTSGEWIADQGASTIFETFSSNHIVVADNGKFFSAYSRLDTNKATWGLYGDLTSDLVVGTSLTLHDCASNTSGYNNVNSGVAGSIFSNSANDSSCAVAGDLVDLSFVVAVNRQSDDQAVPISFTAGGATLSVVHTATSTTYFMTVDPGATFVTGTGSSHRINLIWDDHSTDIVKHTCWDEGTAGITATTTVFSNSGNPLRVIGWAADIATARVTILVRNESPENVYFVTGIVSGTPAFGSAQLLSALTVDRYNGTSQDGGTSTALMDTYNVNNFAKVVMNPSNPVHTFFALDMVHADGVRRAQLFEITDVTAYVGVQISQYTSNQYQQFRVNSTYQWLAQTFTATAGSSRIRTAAFKLYQIGNIPSSNLWVELWATSGGAPSGSALATSQNIDPSKISTSSSGQWCYFNLPSTTLTNGTVYALVLKGDFAVSGSNYLDVIMGSSGLYSGGAPYSWNGTAWDNSPFSTTYDLTFEINGDWVTDVGQARNADSTSFLGSYALWDSETQIGLIDVSNVQLTSRREAIYNGAAVGALTGHVFRSVLAIGNGSTQSVLSARTPLGYIPNQFDSNLILNVALGSPTCAQQNISTGALTTNGTGYVGYEDRSGINYTNNGVNGSPTPAADSNYASGYKTTFNGTSDAVAMYLNPGGLLSMIDSAIPFAIEAEIKPSVLGGVERVIVSQYYGSAGYYGWYFNINSSGYLNFVTTNTSPTSAVVTASDITEPLTQHKVRVTWDGTTCKLWRSTSAPYTSFTEVASYSSQQALLTTNGTLPQLYIGSKSDPTGFFAGEISYVKYVKGASSFVYNGFFNQAPIINHINLGKLCIARQYVGTNSQTAGVNYANPVMIKTPVSAAVVDSYDMGLLFNKTLANSTGNNIGIQLSMNRNSIRNNSKAQGVIVNFNKQ